MITALSIVAGGLLNVLVAIGIEYLRRPRINLQIKVPADDVRYPRGHPAPVFRAKYLNVLVSNVALPKPLRWMSRNPALQCHAEASFHRRDGSFYVDRTLPLRWASAPEPVVTTIHFDEEGVRRTTGRFFDVNAFKRFQRVDLHAGETDEVTLVARMENDQDCFGWNNDSYSFGDWRNASWRLPPDVYLVRLTITSGHKTSQVFRLINDVDINDFRLDNPTGAEIKSVPPPADH